MRYQSRLSPELSLASSLLSVSPSRSWLTPAWAGRRGSGGVAEAEISTGIKISHLPPPPPPSLHLTHSPHSNLSLTVLALQRVWPLQTESGCGLAPRWAWFFLRGSELNLLLLFPPISMGLGGQISSRGGRPLLRLAPHGGAPRGRGGGATGAKFGTLSVAMALRRIRGLEITEETIPPSLHVAPEARRILREKLFLTKSVTFLFF